MFDFTEKLQSIITYIEGAIPKMTAEYDFSLYKVCQITEKVRENSFEVYNLNVEKALEEYDDNGEGALNSSFNSSNVFSNANLFKSFCLSILSKYNTSVLAINIASISSFDSFFLCNVSIFAPKSSKSESKSNAFFIY